MLKLIITADLHIFQKFDMEDLKQQLLLIVETCKSANELWILGDIFHTAKPTPPEIGLLVWFINQISIPIYIVYGNHDKISDTEYSLDWLPKLHNNVTLYTKTQTRIIDGTKVLFGHFNVKESLLGAYDMALQSSFGVEDLDCVVAFIGHIHKGQVICGVNKVAYHPGSLTYLDFGERKDKKSFLVVEFTAGKFLVKTVPVHPTPIYQLDISSDTFNIEILKNIEPTARVKVKITYSDPAINKLEFIKQLRKINVKEMKIVFKFLSPGLEELRANQSPNYGVTIEELFPKFVEEFNIDEEVVKLIRKNL